MLVKARVRASTLLVGLAMAGCSGKTDYPNGGGTSSGGTPPTPGVGGYQPSGGALGLGGAPVQGGVPSTGGSLTGGKWAEGGSVTEGGAAPTGGIVSAAGEVAYGGAAGEVAFGGTAGAGLGGRATGGEGGAVAAGGAPPTVLEVNWGTMIPRGSLGGELLLATNSSGNLVAAGQTDDVTALGSDAYPAGEEIPFLFELTPAGEQQVLWTYPDASTFDAMTVRADGRVVLAGQLGQAVTLGGMTADPVDDGYYVAIVDLATGLADQLVGATTTGSAWVRSVASDGSSNFYVVGGISRTDPEWTESAFVTKYSPTGEELWHREFENCDSTGVANDVAVDPSGPVVIAGAFNCTIQFGDLAHTTTASSDGFQSYNGFVAWLDPDSGDPANSIRFGGDVFDYAHTVDVAAPGVYRVTGTVSEEAEIGEFALTGHASGSAFVAELDASGVVSWARVFSGDTVSFGSVTDRWQRTHVVGRFDGPPYDLGADVEGSESFVATADSTGSITELRKFVTNANGAWQAAVDGGGGLWVSGEFTDTLHLSASEGAHYLVRFAPSL